MGIRKDDNRINKDVVTSQVVPITKESYTLIIKIFKAGFDVTRVPTIVDNIRFYLYFKYNIPTDNIIVESSGNALILTPTYNGEDIILDETILINGLDFTDVEMLISLDEGLLLASDPLILMLGYDTNVNGVPFNVFKKDDIDEYNRSRRQIGNLERLHKLIDKGYFTIKSKDPRLNDMIRYLGLSILNVTHPEYLFLTSDDDIIDMSLPRIMLENLNMKVPVFPYYVEDDASIMTIYYQVITLFKKTYPTINTNTINVEYGPAIWLPMGDYDIDYILDNYKTIPVAELNVHSVSDFRKAVLDRLSLIRAGYNNIYAVQFHGQWYVIGVFNNIDWISERNTSTSSINIKITPKVSSMVLELYSGL